MQLAKALRISASSVIAFVGAGGKTTAMFRAAQELAPALVTTTTHLGAWQAFMANVHFEWGTDEPMPEMEATLGGGITLVTGRSFFRSGLRQVVFGLLAAGVTFAIGKLIGISILG